MIYKTKNKLNSDKNDYRTEAECLSLIQRNKNHRKNKQGKTTVIVTIYISKNGITAFGYTTPPNLIKLNPPQIYFEIKYETSLSLQTIGK